MYFGFCRITLFDSSKLEGLGALAVEAAAPASSAKFPVQLRAFESDRAWGGELLDQVAVVDEPISFCQARACELTR
jgi:hypothetical protein